MPTPDPLRPGERLFALVLVLFAGFAFSESYGISGFDGLTTGGVMPMFASGVLVVAGLVILSDTLRRRADPAPGAGALIAFLLPLRVVLFALLVAAYAAAIPVLGFVPASAALIFVAVWALWRRGPLPALAIALASSGAVYGLFRVVFKVVLPTGSLWQ